jgi:hypothetical protein
VNENSNLRNAVFLGVAPGRLNIDNSKHVEGTGSTKLPNKFEGWKGVEKRSRGWMKSMVNGLKSLSEYDTN